MQAIRHMTGVSNLQPDMVTFNNAITALQRAGDTQMVAELVMMMNAQGLNEPGVAV